ncbi:MAG: crossover junction endodeoxyribonuclease RuvC [Rhodospirillaceae bacterium]|nr:crossover junction endodeoxyribonuclease RuvC [Rhodospirillaceae bacterium]|tara:strand:- start:20280 stop:20804 length:525 start_codon:yes stop_codon:yes gene_type:complete
MKLIGLDPGLRATGWGIIDVEGNNLGHVADGTIHVPAKLDLADRLATLYRVLGSVIETYRPEEAAVEETFVNRNPSSTLKLGQARGVVLLAPAMAEIPVSEYPANVIKKSLVGAGHAGKDQVKMMVRTILPGASLESADAADALAVAVCHAHHRRSRARWDEGVEVVHAASPAE